MTAPAGRDAARKGFAMARETRRTEQVAAHRAQLRRMTTARQAAEQYLLATRGRTAEDRQAAEARFRAEMARIDAEHRAWLSIAVAGHDQVATPSPSRPDGAGAST
jgi:hypothetical protein